MNKFNELEIFLTEEAKKLNIEILKYKFYQGNKTYSLNIVVESLTKEISNLEDCEKIFNLTKLWLKNENLLNLTHINIETPSIERELYSIKDFEKYINHEIKLELKEKFENQRKYIGFIKNISYDLISLEANNKLYQFYFNQIKIAKLNIKW